MSQRHHKKNSLTVIEIQKMIKWIGHEMKRKKITYAKQNETNRCERERERKKRVIKREKMLYSVSRYTHINES